MAYCLSVLGLLISQPEFSETKVFVNILKTDIGRVRTITKIIELLCWKFLFQMGHPVHLNVFEKDVLFLALLK